MLNFLVSTPHEDKAVFLLRLCILILTVSKNVREPFFQGVELIRGKLTGSRETWRHNNIQKKTVSGVGVVDYI